MIPMSIKEKSLVIYKNKPAIATEIAEKISISIAGGEKLKVRGKDVELIHPGPCALSDLAELPKGDVRGAWELLEGEKTTFNELAELIYGEYTPQTAFALYTELLGGVYFSGNAAEIKTRVPDEVESEEKKRGEKQKGQIERDAFLERFRAKTLVFPDDKQFLQDVEALAYGQTNKSRTLKDMGKPETPEEAHKLLLDSGAWTVFVNPHPQRHGCSLASAKTPVSPPPDEERVDLTRLSSFAIDNAWSTDPDDAIAIEGNVLFVHIADPAASIIPDSPADKEARARGATLYLPEGASRMICEEGVSLFALGYRNDTCADACATASAAEISPALTFKMTLDSDSAVAETEIFPSWVKVARLTYEEADEKSASPECAPLFAFAEANCKRRQQSGAVSIDFPEVHISVCEREISIEPVKFSRAASMVQECMLIAGEAAARWALQRKIPFPFVSQDMSDLPKNPLPGLAGSYQLRRCMRPRTLSTKPADHFGLGLAVYTQVTSPLRRYTDLLAHQQIRLFLRGEKPLSEEDVLIRLAASEAAALATVHAERASRAHWTAAYLSDKKKSVWEGVMVEKKGDKSVVLIPDLGVETQVLIRSELEPNQKIRLVFSSVKMPEGEILFNQ
ncbi:MAG: RNB domain-containing ribonuclease [Treponema sp.]|jgi:exoribonuclease-2|nr:RNB domain-containing ribonuclease [Treponema sp.]